MNDRSLTRIHGSLIRNIYFSDWNVLSSFRFHKRRVFLIFQWCLICDTLVCVQTVSSARVIVANIIAHFPCCKHTESQRNYSVRIYFLVNISSVCHLQVMTYMVLSVWWKLFDHHKTLKRKTSYCGNLRPGPPLYGQCSSHKLSKPLE